MAEEKTQELAPDEIELIGGWIKKGSKLVADRVLERIEWLLRERLQKIGADETGWKTIYCDPQDGRFWEHVYPKSFMHGGGPPALVNLSEEETRSKYPNLFA